MEWPKLIWEDVSGRIPRCPICTKPLATPKETLSQMHISGRPGVCQCAQTANPGELLAQALHIHRLPNRTSLRRKGSGWAITCPVRSFTSIYWWLWLAVAVAGLLRCLEDKELVLRSRYDITGAITLNPVVLRVIAVGFVWWVLWLTLGRIIIRWDSQRFSIFIGCWRVGRRHQFDWAQLAEVHQEIRQRGSFVRRVYNVIVLIADRIYEFGRNLESDQRALIIAVLLGKGTLPSALADTRRLRP